MLVYILRRVLIIIPMLLAVSIVAFLVIQAPPGDFLTVYISQLESRGEQVADDQAQALRLRWGLDQPLSVQYLKWLRSMLRGNIGILHGLQQTGDGAHHRAAARERKPSLWRHCSSST